MLVRRLGVGALLASLALAGTTLPLGAASGDKQLARVKGIVGYEPQAGAPFKAIFGRLDLPDDAVAVTQAGGAAVLRLADSSEIDIGEKTSVQVGAFNAVSSGKQNEIVLNGGALHFNIRHPAGGQSNYKFTTATSQIAVRGTEGFLISSVSGTQVVCVSCAAGDVSIQTGAGTVSIVTGQTATVAAGAGGSATVTVSSNTAVSNSVTNQFNNATSTTTSSAGTTTATAGTTSVATGAGGTIATVAGATGAAAVAVAATGTGGSSSASSNACNPGPIVAAFSVGGSFSAFASFPQPFSLSLQQSNPCAGAAFAVTTANVSGPTNPVVSLNPVTSTLNGTTLSSTVTGNVNGPGAFSLSVSASGATVGVAAINVYGAVTSSQQSLSFTSTGNSASQSVTFTQPGPGTGNLSLVPNCVSGAVVTASTTSGPSPLTVTFVATSPPSSPSSSAACTVTVSGPGTGPANSFTLPVNITTTSIGISNTLRNIPTITRSPK